MTKSERFKKAEALFHDAEAMDPSARRHFLEAACHGDEELLKEVRSLLEFDELAGGLFEDPAMHQVARDIANNGLAFPGTSSTLATGTLVGGRYEILEVPRKGGMAQVYKAKDRELPRFVAIKVLSPELADQPDLLRSFEREAETISSLNHPCVCTLHDKQRDGDIYFLVLEYIEGDTLRKRFEQPLALEEFTRIALHCLEGLQAAHEKPILHGDIKPENIMLDTKGHVKLCDFGLAKWLPSPDAPTSRSSGLGAVWGTLGYMAPEVLEGKKADARSDIFSLGVVFYEALSGHNPFLGSSVAATRDRTVSEEPKLLSQLKPSVSRAVSKIIAKMMAKSPSARYAKVSDVLNDFKMIQRQKERRYTAALAMAIIIAGLAGLFAVTRSPEQKTVEQPVAMPVPKNLVVLPFRAVGTEPQDQAYSDGLTETVTAKLTRLSAFHGLQVAAAGDVRERQITTVKKAYTDLGATVVLDASFQRSQDSSLIVYSLLNANDGRLIATDTLTGRVSAPFQLQDEVVLGVAGMLGLDLTPQNWQAMSPRGTNVAQAYEFYIRGLGLLVKYDNPDNVQKAIISFEEALALDKNYADAYAAIGEAYWRKYRDTEDARWIGVAEKSCERAVSLNPGLTAGHTCLGSVHNSRGNYEKAVEELEAAIQSEPTNDSAFRELAAAKERLGDLKGAEDTFLRAVRLRPHYWAVYANLGRFYSQRARYAQAAVQYEQAAAMAPNNGLVYFSLGGIYIYMNHYEDAISAFEKSIRIRPSFQAYSNLGSAYLSQRQFDKAIGALEEAAKLNGGFVAAGNLARAYYFAPGRRQQSMEVYNRAIGLAEGRLEVNARDPDAHIMLAEYYSMIGKRADALAHLKQVEVESNPEFSQIGAIVYNQLGDQEAALGYLEKAVSEGFSRAEIRNSPEFDNLRDNPRFQRLLANK